MDYKQTLNLPTTAFPMKANLAQREPETLQHWENIQLYQKIRQTRRGRPHFILPDGPPYANGHIHIGHAVNKTLKDMVLKIKTLSDFDAPFVPGWDCHGLPIELNVEKKVGKPGPNLPPPVFRQACRLYAEEQIALQKKGFQRLGVLGDWAHPYLTMDFKFEANVIRALSVIIQQGHFHQGKKPVHWCLECGSALAEAEVEYADKMSPALDIRFRVTDIADLKKRLTLHDEIQGEACIPIWTTTPWTLPANQAVALNPEARYVLVKTPLDYLVIAEALLESTVARYAISDYSILTHFNGAALEGLMLQHPFYDRTVPVVLGEHVTLDTGTGAVHTAPAHGLDDFLVGQVYHLPLDNPVNTSTGCFNEQLPFLAGKHVRKCDASILELLQIKNNLLHQTTIQHSYPHCWRHKTPLIFLATPQWFISMEQQGLREHTLATIPSVHWVPAWGQARITNMIANRPDWCVSRQRHWGTPLSLIVHKKTKALHPRLAELMEEVALRVEKHGIEAWHDLSLETLLPHEHQEYEKVNDTLDVWFDSGVMHYAVLKQRPDLSFPADLFLEGSDQHRGWFQSSLLTSMAMYSQAPFKTVLTHGFTVDSQGRKMSKSLGTVIAPEKITDTLGADVLRLWIASTDYSGDLNVSEEILKRTADTYRKLRNTMRFLLANLHDFTPNDILPTDQLLAIDAFMLEQGRLLQEEVCHFYHHYQFHLASQKLHHFCTIDLSSFYLDIIKDRQYTCQKNSRARRSAQTTLYYLAEILVRLYAPILSFTAEEVWKHLPGERDVSVFLCTWYTPPSTQHTPAVPDTTWQAVIRLREIINKELEKLRTQGQIGGNLDAEINIYCAEDTYQTLAHLKNELRFAFITSEATLHPLAEKPASALDTDLPDLFISVSPASAPKCERCWHHRPEVGIQADHPTLCRRCIENVAGTGEKREFV
ncbi:MAG: isoleucine--tRNA ligase [Gammaproteobacteria bacterium]|nr:isoleucine--tRNA ligase [Gammaproteobacteria bacterium]